ncbi:MAG: hypothetical protein ACYTAO_02635 [Planctomycetota bacterium]
MSIERVVGVPLADTRIDQVPLADVVSSRASVVRACCPPQPSVPVSKSEAKKFSGVVTSDPVFSKYQARAELVSTTKSMSASLSKSSAAMSISQPGLAVSN